MFKPAFTYIVNPSIITNSDCEVVRLSSGNFLIYHEENKDPAFIGKDEKLETIIDLRLKGQGVSFSRRLGIIQAIKVLREQ
jgi:hypothetical protein